MSIVIFAVLAGVILAALLVVKKNSDEETVKHENEFNTLSGSLKFLGIKCVSSPYPISWNDSDVKVISKNAFFKDGHIYKKRDSCNDKCKELVVVINILTREYLWLDFQDEASKQGKRL